MGNAILRLGWEFNGGWMPWRVTKQAQAEAYGEYWRQIVKTMRAVPGAEKLNFCWNPNFGYQAYPLDKSWPGDDYVDNIGIDIYDDGYEKGTYPWPADATAEDIQARRERAWETYYKGSYGLLWFKKFAAQHHKPLSIPEWGVNRKPDKHGGLDNPYFVEQMHKLICDPANNVEWHCYFDVEAGDGGHQLSPGLNNRPSQFPKSAELFHKLFAVPGAATKAAEKAP